MQVKITITKKHIAEAKEKLKDKKADRCVVCPTALALADKLPEYVASTLYLMSYLHLKNDHLNAPHFRRLLHSQPLVKWIERFDETGKAVPASFILTEE